MKTAHTSFNALNFRLPKLPKPLEHRAFECDLHGEYLGVFDLKNQAQVGKCPWCMDVDFIASVKTDIIRRNFASAHIPRLYAENSLVDYMTETQEQANVLKAIRSYVENFQQNPSRSLIILGSTGTGKTHLSVGIIKALLNRGMTCRYTVLGDALASIKESYGNQTARNEAEILNDYIAPDLLVLDELGLSELSKTEMNLFYRILDGRYTKARATVLISNLEKDKFARFVGERIYDRLRSNNGRFIGMFFESYR